MRVPCWLALVGVLVLGCRVEVSEPDLRRPIEAMPAGACNLLLASDLANTWQRAEAHDAQAILQRALPPDLQNSPQLLELRARLGAFETRTGTSVREDLWLNLLKRRLAVGVYPGREDAGAPELLFVAELHDAERFRNALAALFEAPEAGWEVERTELDGQPAWRLSDAQHLQLLVLQDGDFLAVATSEALVRGAIALQRGGGGASALQAPACVAALDELGRHSAVLVSMDPDGAGSWSAQGFTWDRDGVRFKRVVPVAAAQVPAAVEPNRRDEILGSIPAGMMLAYYGRAADMVQLRRLFQGVGCFEMHSLAPAGEIQFLRTASAAPGGASAAAPPGLELLPFGLADALQQWAGDEMAFVLADLMPTALAPLPNAALLLEVQDRDGAARMLEEMQATLAALPFVGGAGFTQVEYGGKTYHTLSQPVLEALSPSYLVDGDVAILASTRELLQQIIDTRRAGKGHLRRDPAFRPYERFVPAGATAVVYAHQTKLHRGLVQVAAMPRLWGENMARGVEVLEGLTVLFEHFPSSATYVEASPSVLTLQGWMRENE